MSDQAYAYFEEWALQWPDNTPETVRAKWDSLQPPYAVGWEFLSKLAAESSGDAAFAAQHEFEPLPSAGADPDGSDDDPVARMFQNYAWVEGAKRMVELSTGDVLDQEQFEFRVPPMKKGVSPWKIFKETHTEGRKTYKNFTLRFGQGLEVDENLPGLQGRCLNIWREPWRERPIPTGAVTDAHVAPYLRVAEFVIPDRAEREHVLDYFACVIQRPNEKINHALVIGSREEGMGKDTLVRPLICALGTEYAREIEPDDFLGNNNDVLTKLRVAVVQEMHNFERRAIANKLKPLCAAPPATLSIRQKYKDIYHIPNVVSMIFFTNEDDALSISKGDRRYFVTWNDGEPREKAFYEEAWAWLADGGLEQVVRWLSLRDISKFNHKGRAPETEAKAMMRGNTRSSLQGWVDDGIEARDAPFDRDLVLINDVIDAVPDYAKYRGQIPDPRRVSAALKNSKARPVTGKTRLPGVEGSRVIWALRRADFYAQQSEEILRGLFVSQRDEAVAREFNGLKETFK
jgi:hypothetical protein